MKFLGNASGQTGGDNACNAVAGNDHATLDRAETDALNIFISPGSKTYADKHEHKSAGAQKKLLFIGKETNQSLQHSGLSGSGSFGCCGLCCCLGGGSFRHFLFNGLYKYS